MPLIDEVVSGDSLRVAFMHVLDTKGYPKGASVRESAISTGKETLRPDLLIVAPSSGAVLAVVELTPQIGEGKIQDGARFRFYKHYRPTKNAAKYLVSPSSEGKTSIRIHEVLEDGSLVEVDLSRFPTFDELLSRAAIVWRERAETERRQPSHNEPSVTDSRKHA